MRMKILINVLRAAKAMGMSGQEIEIIKSAFNTAGNNTPLMGATITLVRRGTLAPISTISVNDVTFKFYDLYPGTYTLNVSKTRRIAPINSVSNSVQAD